jgi:hypothetical protein
VTISDPLWEAIETDFARCISTDVRQRVEEATRQYVASAAFEIDTVPLAAPRAHLDKIRRALERVRELLSHGSRPGPDYARHLLQNHIRDERLGGWASNSLKSTGPYWIDPIAALIDVLNSCTAGCASAVRELDDPDFSVAEGEAWDRWIGQLAAILTEAGLRVGVAKHAAYEERPSAFVSLVDRLQKSLPSFAVRHAQSLGALAKAINSARRGTHAAQRIGRGPPSQGRSRS